MTNAIKFSKKGTHIDIYLEQVNLESKQVVQIKVIDEGKGIPIDFLPRIFEKFSQVDSSSTRLHGGLGLGLEIVRNLLELQGGTVQADSLGDNKGSTFTVTLPLANNTSISDALEKQSKNRQHPVLKSTIEDSESVNLDGFRIHVVDDEEFAREAFGELLNSWGADVRTAAAVSEALNIFLEFRPHILMSDIGMPGEDGYSLIRKVRALEKEQGSDIPTLALTAFASGEDVDRAHSAGFTEHLEKPVELTDLARVINRLIRSI